MNAEIALLLTQDGITNGAVYALLALSLVLVFTVTRVIFIPQGEFVSFAALTLATLQLGKVPGTVWLLVGGGALVALKEFYSAIKHSQYKSLPKVIGQFLLLPTALALITIFTAPMKLHLALQVLLTLLLVVPLGPILYRLAYEPMAEASVLVLLIASVALHLALTGIGLIFFGPEGVRTPPFSEASFELGAMRISGQSLWVLGASALLIAGLYLAFGKTLYGKALRATAINRNGAHLVGISAVASGRASFMLAALIGAVSGLLIGPITTIYYDSGFLIGLKGFVGAIIGGLVSYPVAAGGALLVGLLESFSSFWASAYKEVIVFTAIIPVLLWRSFTSHHVEEDE
jgi:branched-chain amino acid transport system permease protein